MNSQIKMHRRNRAVEADQEPSRMSRPSIQAKVIRQSVESRYESKLTFRSSDLHQLPLLTPRTKEVTVRKEKASNEGSSEKTIKNLLSTFTHLQLKLEEAKKQLNLRPTTQLYPVSLEQDSNEGGAWGGGGCLEDALEDKMDESTINLESNKRLVNALKSKERLIWANKIKTYYLKEVALGIVGINERAVEHIAISFEVMKSCQNVDLPNQQVFPRVKVNLPLARENAGKKVLVLDLDETLFHCEETRNSPDDMQIDIPVENGVEKTYLSIRPYAISFLKRARKHFEIIAFTASQKCYADAILNEIDPDSQYIQHRLYRQHCVRLHNKVYAKDLSIINRDLSKMVLVDNSPFSYLYQIENGIPILPYTSGEDSELLALEKYLDKVRLQRDVRQLNLSTFKFHKYFCYDDCQQLVKQLYCQSNPPY